MPIRTMAPRRSTVIFAFGLSGISDIIVSSDEDPAPGLLSSARTTVVFRADRPARPPSAAARKSRLSVVICASISISRHCALARGRALRLLRCVLHVAIAERPVFAAVIDQGDPDVLLADAGLGVNF